MWRTALILGLVLAQPGVAATQQAIPAELARLHEDLNLNAGQEPAWQAYAQAITPSADALDRHRAAEQLLPLEPTPRRIALLSANIAADQAEFRRQSQAVMAFYNQLSPEQQRVFDRETAPQSGNPGPQAPRGAPAAAPQAPPQQRGPAVMTPP